MADLELSLPCKTKAGQAGSLFMWAFWPVWALLAPFVILATVLAISVFPVVFDPALSAALIGGSFLVFLSGIMLTAMLEDDQVFLTAQGISFPLAMLPLVQFRRHRSWQDIASADISGDRGSEELRLKFKSGGIASLPLAAFSKSNLEQLLLALELWGKESERTPQLIEYQRQLQNTNKGAEAVSYTQLWEEELGRRYSGTTFVPLEPGKQIGRRDMKVVAQLGFGGWSAVYLVEHGSASEKRTTVLKESVLPAGLEPAIEQKAREQFAREAKLLQKLAHPSICRVLDHFTEDGRSYLQLEHVPGANLRQHVRQFGLPAVGTVATWAAQLADILHFLHSQEPVIVHRDISPDNLMLRPDGTIMLIDFGAANEICGNATGTMVGKQAYMAPEQVRGKSTAASDVYGFGCTLHHLLTGSDPAPLVASQPIATRKDTHPDLNAIVAACTEFDAAARPQDWQDLRQKLTEIARSCSQEARAASSGWQGTPAGTGGSP